MAGTMRDADVSEDIEKKLGVSSLHVLRNDDTGEIITSTLVTRIAPQDAPMWEAEGLLADFTLAGGTGLKVKRVPHGLQADLRALERMGWNVVERKCGGIAAPLAAYRTRDGFIGLVMEKADSKAAA